MNQQSQSSNRTKAFAIYLTANLIWFFSFIYPNHHDVKAFQTSFVRGIMLLIIGFLFSRNQSPSQGSSLSFPHQSSMVIKRSCMLTFYGWGMAFSQFYLPLPIVHTISGSGPLFVFIIDYYLNGIEINQKQLTGIAFGIIGLILAVNGRLIITYIDPTYQMDSQFNYRTSSPIIIVLVSVLLVFVNILWAYATVITKSLNYNPHQLCFHNGIVLMYFSGVLFCTYEQHGFSLEKMFLAIGLSGLPSTISILMQITAVKMMKNTGMLVILNFSLVIWGQLMSVVWYNENQNPICSIGIILIIFGVSKTILSKNS